MMGNNLVQLGEIRLNMAIQGEDRALVNPNLPISSDIREHLG